MTRVGLLFTATLLAGCASDAPFPPPPIAPPAPIYTPAPAPPPVRDTCGATALQSLIGKPRTEIPIPVNPGGRRVYCHTCPVTMDYSPGRQNIIFDADTGMVREVKCG